jgi:predicted ATPase
MRFEIPQVDESNYELSIDTREVLVFIGANGSGKTRLGSYLESDYFH